jgi:hypothetical protein
MVPAKAAASPSLRHGVQRCITRHTIVESSSHLEGKLRGHDCASICGLILGTIHRKIRDSSDDKKYFFMKQEGFINERTNNKEFDIKEQTENRETKIFTRTLKLILRNEAILPYSGLIFSLLYG